jgi:hypothetical protein
MFAESSEEGIFLSNMHGAYLLFNMQSSNALKWKLTPVIISGHLSIFKRFIIFQSAFIFFQSAFIFLSKRFYSNFRSVSQRLFIFSNCESALFIFFFQKHYSGLL